MSISLRDWIDFRTTNLRSISIAKSLAQSDFSQQLSGFRTSCHRVCKSMIDEDILAPVQSFTTISIRLGEEIFRYHEFKYDLNQKPLWIIYTHPSEYLK